jgi:hypothetical protein
MRTPCPARWVAIAVFICASILNYLDRQILATTSTSGARDRRAGALNVNFHKEAHIDPARLMSLAHTEGAQFTLALRLPLDGARDARRVLDLLDGQLMQLSALAPSR